MRKIILTVLVGSLITTSAAQIAAAGEHHVNKVHRGDFRGTYNQLSGPSERNVVNFGFGGRDSSRVGGQDPSLHPSGS